jgi:hypothetical protein
MNVPLLTLDSTLPNVAWRRLAAHPRAHGGDVTLRHTPTTAAEEPAIGDRFDRLDGSALFERIVEGARP